MLYVVYFLSMSVVKEGLETVVSDLGNAQSRTFGNRAVFFPHRVRTEPVA